MTAITDVTASTITVLVPLAVRRRSGRPMIVLPDQDAGLDRRLTPARDRGPAVLLRAIARAWDWRRRLEAGEFATLQDLAAADNVTLPFVSRFIRLAYLSPFVLERLLTRDGHVAVPVAEVSTAVMEPWLRQLSRVLGQHGCALDPVCGKPEIRCLPASGRSPT